MPVYFHNHEITPRLPEKRRLKRFLEELFQGEGKKLEELRYIFCTDPYLLTINQDFLRHDTYTDIITFDLSEEPAVIAGEVYISAERVKENAREFGVSFQQELHRVIFHGALHLCNYNDKQKEEQARMRQKENEYLAAYFNK